MQMILMSVRVPYDADVSLGIAWPLEPASKLARGRTARSRGSIEWLLKGVIDEDVLDHIGAKPCLEHGPLALRVEVVRSHAMVNAGSCACSTVVREVDVAATLVTVVPMERTAVLDAGIADLDARRAGPPCADDFEPALECRDGITRHEGATAIMHFPESRRAQLDTVLERAVARAPDGGRRGDVRESEDDEERSISHPTGIAKLVPSCDVDRGHTVAASDPEQSLSASDAMFGALAVSHCDLRARTDVRQIRTLVQLGQIGQADAEASGDAGHSFAFDEGTRDRHELRVCSVGPRERESKETCREPPPHGPKLGAAEQNTKKSAAGQWGSMDNVAQEVSTAGGSAQNRSSGATRWRPDVRPTNTNV